MAGSSGGGKDAGSGLGGGGGVKGGGTERSTFWGDSSAVVVTLGGELVTVDEAAVLVLGVAIAVIEPLRLTVRAGVATVGALFDVEVLGLIHESAIKFARADLAATIRTEQVR